MSCKFVGAVANRLNGQGITAWCQANSLTCLVPGCPRYLAAEPLTLSPLPGAPKDAIFRLKFNWVELQGLDQPMGDRFELTIPTCDSLALVDYVAQLVVGGLPEGWPLERNYLWEPRALKLFAEWFPCQDSTPAEESIRGSPWLCPPHSGLPNEFRFGIDHLLLDADCWPWR